MTNRPLLDPAHLPTMMPNTNSNVPQYDRSTIVQPQPLVEPHIPEVIDPDDEIVIPTSAPLRSQNCKFFIILFPIIDNNKDTKLKLYYFIKHFDVRVVSSWLSSLRGNS